MIQPGLCKHCGSSLHSSLMCFYKARQPLRKTSNKSGAKYAKMRREWFLRPENAPDEEGQWLCYLGISPECTFTVNRLTLNLEHVRSRVRHPELKFDPDNLMPACSACNQVKQSLDLEDLVDKYPHLQKIIDRMVEKKGTTGFSESDL